MNNTDFLICSERSGSNLITKLIDNHPTFCGPTPAHLFRVFIPVIDSYGDLNDVNNWSLLVSDVLKFHNSKIGVWEVQFTKDELLAIPIKSLYSLVTYIYAKEATAHNKERVFVKEVKTYKIIDKLIEQFPKAKFIWQVRDPRDMALSWMNSPVHRGDIVRGSNVWFEDQKATISLFRKLKSENKILLIKYEDLISNQEDTLVKVCDFLDVKFDNQMLEFHKKKISVDNSRQTDNWKNLDKKIMEDNSKKFLRDLDRETIRYIEFKCASEMQYLGYQFEFDALSVEEYEFIHNTLLGKERYEKPEFKLISATEKEKRKKWYKKYQEISNRK